MTRQKSSNSALAAGSRLVRHCLASILATIFFLGVGMASQPAYAQQDGQLIRFGIVDMNAVMQQSNAIKVIRQALDEQNALFQEQISDEELALRRAEKQLNDERSSISEDEFEVRLSAFEQRVVQLQRRIQAQKSSFDRSFNDAQERLQQELVRVISDIAAERGYAIVIQKQNAVIYDSSLDITQLALERLNERTKNLKITLEKKE